MPSLRIENGRVHHGVVRLAMVLSPLTLVIACGLSRMGSFVGNYESESAGGGGGDPGSGATGQNTGAGAGQAGGPGAGGSLGGAGNPGAGGTGAGGDPSSGAGGCGTVPDPPGGSCPGNVCNGGCIGPGQDTCVILCTNCDPATIICPAGFACDVRCTGVDACDHATIECAAGTACTVTCSLDGDSCGSAIVNCNDAALCELQCIGGCTSATQLNCGSGACECGGAGPTVTCGSACACSGC